VSTPFDPAVSLTGLDQNKEALGQAGVDVGSLILNNLVPELVKFEVGRNGQKVGKESEALGSRLKTMLVSLLNQDQEVARLSPQHLLDLYRLLQPTPAVTYRAEPVAPISPAHEPMDAEMIPGAMERFFGWVQSPGFTELHAIQQMTVAQMRLFQIHPFSEGSQEVVSVFSQYFLVRNGYLPALLRLEDIASFYQALDQAFQFSSETLLQLNIGATQRSYRCLQKVLGVWKLGSGV